MTACGYGQYQLEGLEWGHCCEHALAVLSSMKLANLHSVLTRSVHLVLVVALVDEDPAPTYWSSSRSSEALAPRDDLPHAHASKSFDLVRPGLHDLVVVQLLTGGAVVDLLCVDLRGAIRPRPSWLCGFLGVLLEALVLVVLNVAFELFLSDVVHRLAHDLHEHLVSVSVVAFTFPPGLRHWLGGGMRCTACLLNVCALHSHRPGA